MKHFVRFCETAGAKWNFRVFFWDFWLPLVKWFMTRFSPDWNFKCFSKIFRRRSLNDSWRRFSPVMLYFYSPFKKQKHRIVLVASFYIHCQRHRRRCRRKTKTIEFPSACRPNALSHLLEIDTARIHTPFLLIIYRSNLGHSSPKIIRDQDVTVCHCHSSVIKQRQQQQQQHQRSIFYIINSVLCVVWIDRSWKKWQTEECVFSIAI